MRAAKFRVARPSDDLSALLPFYQAGLGFELLGSFDNHAGFDGIMLGHPDLTYHLEFTRHRGHPAGTAPTKDNLLVFYLPDQAEYVSAVQRMEGAGFPKVTSYNPYWDRIGATFEDPDGYRVVLANADWPGQG